MDWFLNLRPHDRFYHVVRVLMELPWVFTFQLKYDHEWDTTLSTALDLGAVEIKNVYSFTDVMFGDLAIWHRNYPCACGEAMAGGAPWKVVTGRPSIMTMRRLQIYIKERRNNV
jgi:hypothetical protein